MIVPLLLLGLGLSPQKISVRCGDVSEKQTAASRSVDGVRVSLRFHGEDDHGKNTHLCQSEYELQVVRPDGSTSETGWNDRNDGEWNRAIAFELEGFASDGRRVIGVISEGGRYPVFQVLIYDLQTQKHDVFLLDSGFLRIFGKRRTQAVHVEGMTRKGEVVLGTSFARHCDRCQMWGLTARKTKRGTNVVELLPAGVPIVPLAQDGETAGSSPDRILTR